MDFHSEVPLRVLECSYENLLLHMIESQMLIQPLRDEERPPDISEVSNE